jgi:hypothetical protein
MMVLGLVLYLGAWAYRIVTRKYYIWLPGYANWLVASDRAPVAGRKRMEVMKGPSGTDGSGNDEAR